MKIRDYYFSEDTNRLYVEFSTKKDGDDFYRSIELEFGIVQYYSAEIIGDFDDVDQDVIKDVLKNYFLDHDLPEETML
jgi:hypothetical protein